MSHDHKRGGDLDDPAVLAALDADLLHVPDVVPWAKPLTDRVGINGRCLYVAKGPSARHAAEALGRRKYWAVATVNEACLIVPGAINWAFFLDLDAIANAKPAWSRIRHLVMPPVVHSGVLKGAGARPDLMLPDLPVDRVRIINQGQIASSEDAIDEAWACGGMLMTDTATMGLHALVRLGYTAVDLLGHDGGVGYAAGLPALSQGKDHTPKRRILESVIRRLEGPPHYLKARFLQS
jgi:hypothetical protein